MIDRRSSVFASQALAARIEAAEADFMARCSEHSLPQNGVSTFAIPIGGGFATYAGPDSPFNKVAGLGFHPLPSDGELDAMESAFRARTTPVQFELSSLGDPDLGARLTARGYRLVSFEHVLGLWLDPMPDLPSIPNDVEVHRGEARSREWIDVVTDGVLHPDTEGVAQHEAFPREVIERAETAMLDAGARLYTAELGGVVAGGASLHVSGKMAQMTGAATAPSHRRRGVQTALVRARLRDAAQTGCDFAVVTTQPGSPSHANTQKLGFDLLYARAVLVGP